MLSVIIIDRYLLLTGQGKLSAEVYTYTLSVILLNAWIRLPNLNYLFAEFGSDPESNLQLLDFKTQFPNE